MTPSPSAGRPAGGEVFVAFGHLAWYNENDMQGRAVAPEVHRKGTGCVAVPKIDVSKFIEQSGIRKARFGGYETADVRQAMQALCTEYEQRLNRAENQARSLSQQNKALEQHCQTLTAQNRRLAEQSAALAGSSETYSRQRTQLDNRLASLQEKNHSLADKLAVLRLKNSDLEKENDELRDSAAKAVAELRVKGRELDEQKAALAAARQKLLEDADGEAAKVIDQAREQAEQIKEEARLEAQAMARAAKAQAQAQARKLVEAAAAEANEVQNAHQLRLNSLRKEVSGLEQQREKLIDFLNRMARELMQVEGSAKTEPVAMPVKEDPETTPELQEVPTPPVELDLGPEAIARAVDELRAQAAAGQDEEGAGEPEGEEAGGQPAQEPEPAPGPEPARQTGPALTEVPGAIFSSPIVRQEAPDLPEETPPTADPRIPVMPDLEEEEEDAVIEYDLPGDDLPGEAATVPEASPSAVPAPTARLTRRRALRVVRALRRRAGR